MCCNSVILANLFRCNLLDFSDCPLVIRISCRFSIFPIGNAGSGTPKVFGNLGGFIYKVKYDTVSADFPCDTSMIHTLTRCTDPRLPTTKEVIVLLDIGPTSLAFCIQIYTMSESDFVPRLLACPAGRKLRYMTHMDRLRLLLVFCNIGGLIRYS